MLGGSLVGACSVLATIGSHVGASGMMPSGLGLLGAVLVCAVTGAAVSWPMLAGRRGRAATVVAALAVAQVFGHVTLMAPAGGHHHDAGTGTSPWMVVAHIGAAALLGVTIAAVEYLYVVAASVLCWLRLIALPYLRPASTSRLRIGKVVVIQPILVHDGLGMRAPPLVGVPAA